MDTNNDNTIRQGVLINDEYLREYSLFPKNYDFTEIRNFIPLAEELHITPIIGEGLHQELIDQISDNEITRYNSSLLLEIYKVLGLAVFYEALPFVWSRVTQVGITHGKSDNSDSVSNKDMVYLQQDVRSKLDYLKGNLKKWLDERRKYYPNYVCDGNCGCPTSRKYADILRVYTTKKSNIDIN